MLPRKPLHPKPPPPPHPNLHMLHLLSERGIVVPPPAVGQRGAPQRVDSMRGPGAPGTAQEAERGSRFEFHRRKPSVDMPSVAAKAAIFTVSGSQREERGGDPQGGGLRASGSGRRWQAAANKAVVVTRMSHSQAGASAGPMVVWTAGGGNTGSEGQGTRGEVNVGGGVDGGGMQQQQQVQIQTHASVNHWIHETGQQQGVHPPPDPPHSGRSHPASQLPYPLSLFPQRAATTSLPGGGGHTRVASTREGKTPPQAAASAGGATQALRPDRHALRQQALDPDWHALDLDPTRQHEREPLARHGSPEPSPHGRLVPTTTPGTASGFSEGGHMPAHSGGCRTPTAESGGLRHPHPDMQAMRSERYNTPPTDRSSRLDPVPSFPNPQVKKLSRKPYPPGKKLLNPKP